MTATACFVCEKTFTLFNRKHHCRLCGEVICQHCSAYAYVMPQQQPAGGGGGAEKVRACRTCVGEGSGDDEGESAQSQRSLATSGATDAGWRESVAHLL